MNFLFCKACLITEQSIIKIIDLVYYQQPLSLFRNKLERQYFECEFSCGQRLLEMKKKEIISKHYSETNIPLIINIHYSGPIWSDLID